MLGSILRRMLAAAIAVAFLAPAGGEARTLDEILSSKKLIVGVNPTLPPLGNFNDKNEIVGFDVDLSQKLATDLPETE